MNTPTTDMERLLGRIADQNEKILRSLNRLNATMDRMKFQTILKNGIVRCVRKESVRHRPAVMADIIRLVFNAFLARQAYVATDDVIRSVMGYYDPKSVRLFITQVREEVRGMIGISPDCILQPDGSVRITNPDEDKNKSPSVSPLSEYLDI